jgi:hypothetical protein
MKNKQRGDFGLLLLSNLESHKELIEILGPDSIYICTDMERKPWLFVLASNNPDICNWLCDIIQGTISFVNHSLWIEHVETLYKNWNVKIPERVKILIDFEPSINRGFKVLKSYHYEGREIL